MAQTALILPKASRAQCEWQNHGFTWWYLAIKSHTQGLCSHPAQLLSLVLPLMFSKSLHLSSPPLKTWEMSFARPMADGIRSLMRGRAPPLPEHVPKRKPLLLGLISPSQSDCSEHVKCLTEIMANPKWFKQIQTPSQ